MNVAILKCLIEESGKLDEGTVMLMVGADAEDQRFTKTPGVIIPAPSDGFRAEVTYGDGATLSDPIGNEIPLSAVGRSPAEAISNLEILLQRWY